MFGSLQELQAHILPSLGRRVISCIAFTTMITFNKKITAADAHIIYYPKQLQKIAYHEAGHAVIGYDLDLQDIESASIIPDENSLGRVIADKQYKKKLSKNDLKGLIRISLAGYVAEQEFNFDVVGKFNDFNEGFNDFRARSYKTTDFDLAISLTKILIDNFYNIDPVLNEQEYRRKFEQILKKCYQKAVREVNDKRSDIECIAEMLLEKDCISGKEIEDAIEQNRLDCHNNIIQQIKSPHKIIVAQYI
jgi:cell division protease FtsH